MGVEMAEKKEGGVSPASSQAELWLEVVRLQGVIERNKVAFENIKAEGNGYRDRAIRAEAALEELRRVTSIPHRIQSDADVAFGVIKQIIASYRSS